MIIAMGSTVASTISKLWVVAACISLKSGKSPVADVCTPPTVGWRPANVSSSAANSFTSAIVALSEKRTAVSIVRLSGDRRSAASAEKFAASSSQ